MVQGRSLRRKDMQSIFDDEGCGHGAFWPNPFGTRPAKPMDVVAKTLKWLALRRFLRLAIGFAGLAITTTIPVHRT
jgi:hypothetical protein